MERDLRRSSVARRRASRASSSEVWDVRAFFLLIYVSRCWEDVVVVK